MLLEDFLKQFDGLDPKTTHIRIEYKDCDTWQLGHDVDIVKTYINEDDVNNTGDIYMYSDYKNDFYNRSILKIKTDY